MNMKSINSIKKNFSKVKKVISPDEPSKLLAEFFNGVVIRSEGK